MATSSADEKKHELITEEYGHTIIRCPHQPTVQWGESFQIDDYTRLNICPRCLAIIQARVLGDLIRIGVENALRNWPR